MDEIWMKPVPEHGHPAGGSRCRLLIFTRVPRLGTVKRRLVAALGEEGALAAHTELLERTLERCVDPVAYGSELWLSGNLDDPQVISWRTRYPLSVHEQVGIDLGARMCAALESNLSGGMRAVLIGSDCPDIDRDYVADAFSALLEHDVVLGPAEDGGYGLIGLSRPAPELFSNMLWGNSAVCRETRNRASAIGLSTVCLREIYDVDRPADWVRYQAVNPSPGKATE